MLGTNVNGFFFITQQAEAVMEGQRSGHIVRATTSLVDRANSCVPSDLASLTKGPIAVRDQAPCDRMRQALLFQAAAAVPSRAAATRQVNTRLNLALCTRIVREAWSVILTPRLAR
jgi:NAD(P)-dependent dehydrogenase (short-subunit alcohol dehydrogenase family)